eukprot:m.306677 g.306677  ORF g.306677 m.306677 type:complete len:289 (+) comp19624_c0_seq3:371-1237(+)
MRDTISRLDRERAQLQARVKALEHKLQTLPAKQAEESDAKQQLQSRLFELQDDNERLRQAVETEFPAQLQQRDELISKYQSRLDELQAVANTSSSARANHDQGARVLQLEQENMELEFAASKVPRLKARIEELTELEALAQAQLAAALREATEGKPNDGPSRQQVEQVQAENRELRAERDKLRRHVTQLKKKQLAAQASQESPVPKSTAKASTEKLQELERVAKRGEEKIAMLAAENQRLKEENQQLRTELDAFDPTFFEEIEDLKYHYREALERNRRYEAELRQHNT